jgi:hypothetical protein
LITLRVIFVLFGPFCGYQKSLITRFLGVYLGCQTIAVFLEDEIHAPFGEPGLLVVTASALLFLVFSCTNRHPFLFAEVNCRMRHYQFLSVDKIHSISPNPSNSFWTSGLIGDRSSLKLPLTSSSHSSSIPELPLFLLSAGFRIT